MAFIARTDEFGNETMRIMLSTNPDKPTVAFYGNLMINCSPDEISRLGYFDNQNRFYYYADDRDMQKLQQRQRQRKVVNDQMILTHQSFKEFEKAQEKNQNLAKLSQKRKKSPNLYFYSWLAANNVAQLQRAIDRGLITQPDDQSTFERAMVVQMKYHRWFQSKCRQLRRCKSDMSLKPTDRRMQWSLSTEEAHRQMLKWESEKLTELKDKYVDPKDEELIEATSQCKDFKKSEESGSESAKIIEDKPEQPKPLRSPPKSPTKPKRCVPDYERINRLALPRRPMLRQSSVCSKRHKDCLKVKPKLDSPESEPNQEIARKPKENVEDLETFCDTGQRKYTKMSKLEILIKELTDDIDRELAVSKTYCSPTEEKTNYKSKSANKVAKGEKQMRDEMQSSKVLPMKLKEKSDKTQHTFMDIGLKKMANKVPAVSSVDKKQKLKRHSTEDKVENVKPCLTQRRVELKTNPKSSGRKEPVMTVYSYRKKEKTIPWR